MCVETRPTLKEMTECPRPDVPKAGGSGWPSGGMTGFFGVGGGFLIVPALTTLLGLTMRRAVATSLAIITVTGLAALASHLAEGAEPDWPLTLVLCTSAAAGGLLGSSLGSRLPAKTLAHAFGIVVVRSRSSCWSMCSPLGALRLADGRSSSAGAGP